MYDESNIIQQQLLSAAFEAIYRYGCEDCQDWIDTMNSCYSDEVIEAFGNNPFEVNQSLADMWECQDYEDPRTGICLALQDWANYFAGKFSHYIYEELVKANEPERLKHTIMEEKRITIEAIVELFKNHTEKKRAKEIKQQICTKLYPDTLIVPQEVTDELSKEVDFILKEDKLLGNESFLIYKNGIYTKRRNRKTPIGITNMPTQYIGTAGECAVMSELMFRGYNANRMMIDEGVDIVATKDNIYYYIQVKTVTLRDGRVYCQIPRYRFDQYVSNQIRYIIVARTNDGNMYFMFDPKEIDKGIYGRYINATDDTIYIKIKFHQRSGSPYLYDEKEQDASYNMNNFRL